MELIAGYKQTEVGVIPVDWRVETVEKISTVGRGRVISHNEIARSRNGRYPVYSSQTTGGGVMGYLDSYEFDGEYITWTTDGEKAGTVFARNGRFNCTNVCGTIRLKSDNHLFVAAALGRVAGRHVSRHVGNPKLMNGVMRKVAFALPATRNEQDAIATALSEVDALLAAQDALIAKKRAIKRGAMQELLAGKRRLPGFGGEWVVKPFGDIAAVSKGEQLHSSESDKGGIYPHYNGGMEPSGFTAKYNTPAFTIAISEGGNSCGYVQRIDRPFWCGGHCYAVVPKTIDGGFLFHALKGRQSEIMGLRVGSGLPNVQKSAIKKFDLRFPSETAEQVAISDVLSEMDAENSALKANRAKTAQLKQGMMQALLTGRIRLV